MNAEKELSEIIGLLRKLGSPEGQAKRMAGQLVKRADQWVDERGMDRVEAMNSLLNLVVSGRNGVISSELEGEKGSGSDVEDDFQENANNSFDPLV